MPGDGIGETRHRKPLISAVQGTRILRHTDSYLVFFSPLYSGALATEHCRCKVLSVADYTFKFALNTTGIPPSVLSLCKNGCGYNQMKAWPLITGMYAADA